MQILAIETSCDESAVAVLDYRGPGAHTLSSDLISSQIELHAEYGGVVPELAAREHLTNLPILFERALEQSAITRDQIDLIAVTRGPGLKGCLLVGVDFARGLAAALARPLLGVNHIEGHLFAPMLDNPALQAPFLALVVSGGHTEIVLVEALGRYKVIARTTDDAAGEAFDKSANLMSIPYPGGAKLAALADQFHGTEIPTDLKLPRVMRGEVNFSFSGLKTAIALLLKREQRSGPMSDLRRVEVAAAIQHSIVDALIDKLRAAILQTGVGTIVVTGGVSANRALRLAVTGLCDTQGAPIQVFFPATQHCMDNAAMIALVAGMRFAQNHYELGWSGVISRWPLEQLK